MRPGAKQFFERRGAPTPPALPYDAEVKWLESTGTQYIDTGIVGSDSLIINAAWEYGSSDASCPPFGCRTSATNRALAITGWFETLDNRLYLNYGSASNWLLQTTIQLYGHRWGVHVENGGCLLYCDGESVVINNRRQSQFSTVSQMILFGFHDSGTGTNTLSRNVRIFSWDVQSNGVLIQSLVPVRIGNEGAMYDKVSGQLFRNAGTGAFLYGPDKS